VEDGKKELIMAPEHRRRWIAAAIAVVGVFSLGGVVYWSQAKPAQPSLSPFAAAIRTASQERKIPVLFQAPQFEGFVDQSGKKTGTNALDGRIWVADFIFTHCAGSCPLVTGKFVALQKSIDDPNVRFVSFSVDPDRDDPATLKDYAGKNNTGEDRWMLLRPPDKQAIFHLAQRMAAIAHGPDADDTIMHTDFFILVDPTGHVRGLYDSKDAPSMEHLQADIAALSRQRAMEAAAAKQGGNNHGE
jgi:protein SCO1/2